MIQLQVLSGARAGQRLEAKTFPIIVGRDPGCALTLHDAGVFSRHFEIRFSPEGFSLAPVGEAVVIVNGAPAATQLLRNGDIVTAGYARLQFWLGALPQRGLKIREALTWLLVAAVAAAQVYLLWRLLAIARS
jgi:hypothetical protein